MIVDRMRDVRAYFSSVVISQFVVKHAFCVANLHFSLKQKLYTSTF